MNFGGLMCGVFAAFRLDCWVKPATMVLHALQMKALKILILTQVIFILWLGILLASYNRVVGREVGSDAARVRSFLFYRGPHHESVMEILIFFAGKIAFVVLLLALLDADTCQ